MVTLTIDQKHIQVAEETTILEAAEQNGIPIPRLCYLKEINEIGACRICCVEVEGKEKLITSCNNLVEDGMVIYTNSPKVRMNRRNMIELILSQHDCRCASCVRSGNCSLQKIANDLNVIDTPFHLDIERIPWNQNFPLIRDSAKCIKCMRCIQICDKVQSLNVWDVESTGSRTTVHVSKNRKIEEADCSLCGQCITHCPTGALRERDDTAKAWRAIDNPKKITVVQVAPAVRTAWGETLGLDRQEATMGKITDALKRLGFDYVFDTSFSADLTIMEEAHEFIQRFTAGECNERPMFTSCCPGWVRFLKSQYPHLVRQLSSAKSPQQMFGAAMKTYFAKSIDADPNDICTVSIMPCLAKKGEQNMELFYEEYAGHDIDIVLTTRELTRMIRAAHIEPTTLQDVPCDELMRDASGAGVIFGATGGVMEAALRTSYFLITGKNPDADAFHAVRRTREDEFTMTAEIPIGDLVVKTAIVSGLGNARRLIERMERGEAHYDFVEVMACPGGCVGGGGQPIHDSEELALTRSQNLYFLDASNELRFCHENPDIQKLYQYFMGSPLSHKAHMLLHTDHNIWEMPKRK